MKKILTAMAFAVVVAAFSTGPVFASECKEGVGGISLSPASEDFNFSGGDIHEGTLKIKNMSANSAASLKVYAAPYSINENSNKDFTTDKPRTQISRWIEFEGPDGYAPEAVFEMEACSEREVKYRVVVPESIPDGGQYAVIFVENAGGENNSGIKTVSRAGMLVYGRAQGGETIETGEILNTKIETVGDATDSDGNPVKKTVIRVGAEVKNTGNVDIATTGDFKVENLFGAELYHHTAYDSILPDATMNVSDTWDNTPMIGLFRVTYSMSIPGAEDVVISQLVFVCPLPVLIVILLFVIVMIVGLVSIIKKRRIRKAKYGF